MFHMSWNVGGVAEEALEVGFQEVGNVSQRTPELLSVQELPRAEEGWSTLHVGPWQVVSHRDVLEWRGCGVGFRSDAWSVLKRKKASRGIWVRLRRLQDGLELWCGSVYLSQGATRETHAAETLDFIGALPATDLPVLFGSDANTPVRWAAAEGERAQPLGIEAKGDYMLNEYMRAGFVISPPSREQWSAPTSRPRRNDAHGRQIDLMGCRRAASERVVIHVDSHRFLGSADHDALTQVISVKQQKRDRVKRGNNRPRYVAKDPVIEGDLSQQQMEQLAKQCTRVRSGAAYKDPPEVKVYFQVAREHKQPEDWKRALRERFKARKLWLENKISNATRGDWGAYREVAKKGANGWEAHFACAQPDGIDPHQAVHAHLQQVYGGDGVPEFPSYPFPEVPRSDDFTSEELQEALRKGKKGKAVGPDRVSHELLVALGNTQEGEQKILTWFNKLLHGEEELPHQWSRASMVLIPKVPEPELPKQVRPICIGSSTCKLFCRMLLARTKHALRYEGSAQSMGAGRQTADYIFCAARLMQLEQEWKAGTCFLKLDVERAFDTLDRGKFMMRLSEKMGSCDELRAWWAMFGHTDAALQTVWGESVIDMTTGVRQGSVESPQMFATVIDWVLGDLARKGTTSTSSAHPGLDMAEIAFVDDLLVWDGSKAGLSRKTALIAREMASWGLRVNFSKCQAYVSPYNKDSGRVIVEGIPLAEDDHLMVMGVHLKVGVAAKEALGPIFARVKARFWALKSLFRAKTPLMGRLKLMDKVLGNKALWCACAFQPDQHALQAVNVLQSELTIWAMRLAKKREEGWVEYRLRSFRSARWVIYRGVGRRWSTAWLARAWDYAGHRARSSEWQPPPPSAKLDGFRDLVWWFREQEARGGKRHPENFFLG